MKRVVRTKFGIALLISVMALGLFAPYSYAEEDIATPEGATGETVVAEEPKLDDVFKTATTDLDFGRATELGRSYTKQLEIINNTANDVIIDASVRKYEDAGDESGRLWEWLVFVGGVSHINVPAGQTKPLNVRAAIPEDAKAGSQYAQIVLVDANENTLVVPVKIDIAGDDLKYSSEVVDGWIEPVRLDEAFNGRVTVKNTGTAGFTSTYQVRAKSFFGGEWKVIKEVSEEVYPNNSVTFSSNDNLGYGVYSIEQRVTFVNAEGRMVESLLSRTVVNLPIVGVAVAGGVVLFIIVLIFILKHHKKSDKAVKKMERAEQKVRKADIARIEKAETKTIIDEKKAAEKDEPVDKGVQKATPKELKESLGIPVAKKKPVAIDVKTASKPVKKIDL